MLLLAAPGSAYNDGPEGSLRDRSTGDWVYEPNGIVIENDNSHLSGTFTGTVSTGNGQIPFANDGSDLRDRTDVTAAPTAAPSKAPTSTDSWVGTSSTGTNHWVSGTGNRLLRGSDR